MKHILNGAGWGIAMVVLLFSPVLLIFAAPLAIGIGLDIFEVAGEAPLALGLCGPVLIGLLARSPARHHIAGLFRFPPQLQVGHAAKLD